LNRLKEAAAAYLRSLQLDPQDWRTNMNLGLVYLALDQLDDAVTYLERASKYSPDNSEIWANLGVALDARGSVVLAEAAYKKSLEIDGDQPTTLLNLGANLITQGKAVDALTVMEEAMRFSQSPPTRKRYADALTLCNKPSEAGVQYDQVIAEDPRFWPAYSDKGFLKLKLYKDGMQLEDSHRQAAMSLWKKSLEMNPNQPRVIAAMKEWGGKSLFGN
ncbi:MAG TPA: tetratricopeptide repeat protein, partial [Tepidisphaeraceae bacterium]|nr:tetratricopeptide repeat protein [Tepidisphaeraceae bacterium]